MLLLFSEISLQILIDLRTFRSYRHFVYQLGIQRIRNDRCRHVCFLNAHPHHAFLKTRVGIVSHQTTDEYNDYD